MAERRVALVTGGSGGIGAGIARRLAATGACVVVTARRKARLKELVAELSAHGAEAHAVALDAADRASIAAAGRLARELAGAPVDWLVNNAGIAVSAPVGRADEGRDLVREHMEVNFFGAVRLTELVLPAMVERGLGRVVNVASSAGLRGYPYVSAYCASKHALVGWSLSAAQELAGKGVTVNLVCPHYVDSPMTDASVARIAAKTGRGEDDARALLASQNPGGRLVTVDEVAAEVARLVTGDENGQIVELTGSPEPLRRSGIATNTP